MCLGKYGLIVEVIDAGRARVSYQLDEQHNDRHDDRRSELVSLAVLVAEGLAPRPGDVVVVSMGMALRIVDDPEDAASEAIAQEVI